ncbi:X-ray repair complementing defective repair in Chinese hamster cells 3 L homeolog isoform X2 [Xenopus laevis]|uniref:X-ray repair complementing defective repair in Chinese hamster cells 3 L homeolog isoform X2 n=1 Tax=Xenopus laevis TaxID=8355 RepID=A0A8J0TG06_XENLA|nr:X-ray repair complementing defective repair in Chinese hamster cells 3 L homeolog isoform X2 [Xenopus laevis]
MTLSISAHSSVPDKTKFCSSKDEPELVMEWDEVELSPRIRAAVRKANIKSAGSILTLSVPELQKLANLSVADVRHLQKAVSAVLRKNMGVTALQMYSEKAKFPSQHQKLSLGCKVLDNFLRGGIPLVGITEIAGESSAGKTQIGLQLCLSVQYPVEYGGLASGAVYICTEDAFPSKRLQQLIKSQHKLRSDVPSDVIKNIRFGDSIFVEHTADVDTLTECIKKKVPVLLLRGSIRLVVIDSIAALFRCEFAAKDAAVKAKHLQTLGAKLHNISNRFITPVLCINQVTDRVREMNSEQDDDLGLQDKKVVPALGISWSNQLLMRVMVARTQHTAPTELASGGILRTMEVVFAPHIAQSSCYYTVDLEGVKGLDDHVQN